MLTAAPRVLEFAACGQVDRKRGITLMRVSCMRSGAFSLRSAFQVRFGVNP